MNGLTRSAIAYDLNISPHRLVVPYGSCTVEFVFSSALYRRNFYERFIDNREKIGTSLTNRFGFTVENDLLCDLKLYTTIEKRGFLIIKDGEKIVCRDSITLNGGNLMSRNSVEP